VAKVIISLHEFLYSNFSFTKGLKGLLKISSRIRRLKVLNITSQIQSGPHSHLEDKSLPNISALLSLFDLKSGSDAGHREGPIVLPNRSISTTTVPGTECGFGENSAPFHTCSMIINPYHASSSHSSSLLNVSTQRNESKLQPYISLDIFVSRVLIMAVAINFRQNEVGRTCHLQGQ
jgi:hypothetical protein